LLLCIPSYICNIKLQVPPCPASYFFLKRSSQENLPRDDVAP
jgi:hypothetical protein